MFEVRRLARTPQPTPLSQQEAGHFRPKSEHAKGVEVVLSGWGSGRGGI